MGDDEVGRVVNCINSCWPEFPFTQNDMRKPTSEKFREVLLKLLRGVLGTGYQLPSVNIQLFVFSYGSLINLYFFTGPTTHIFS